MDLLGRLFQIIQSHVWFHDDFITFPKQLPKVCPWRKEIYIMI